MGLGEGGKLPYTKTGRGAKTGEERGAHTQGRDGRGRVNKKKKGRERNEKEKEGEKKRKKFTCIGCTTSLINFCE